MSFNFAPWAVNGARTGAALARVDSFAGGGGRSGIVRPSNLKVSALAVNGNGVRISSGSAFVVNGYQTTPDQSYVVTNPAEHVVLPASMPSAIPSTGYYLVCVVVGDPEFDQSEHPYMPSTPIPAEDQADFEYVRVVIVPCSANTTNFEQLGYSYPAYALARLEIPPNTTTITPAMITDLRELAQPRSQRDLISGQPSAGTPMTQTDVFVVAPWTDFTPSVKVPVWATKVTVVVTVTGALHMDPEVQGQIRVRLGSLVGPGVTYAFEDSNTANGAERVQLTATLTGNVGAMAGTSQTLSIEGFKSSAYAGYLTTYAGQTHIFDVQFSEGTV